MPSASAIAASAIPEHHLLNILLIPSPLQMAVKVAAHTENILLMTSVCQLPLRDMRIFAGEVVQAQALCDGRLMLGVGKGAFAYETERIGVPFERHQAALRGRPEDSRSPADA